LDRSQGQDPNYIRNSQHTPPPKAGKIIHSPRQKTTLYNSPKMARAIKEEMKRR